MSEIRIRCGLCCGLGRVADAPCRMCLGAGSVLACAQCGVEPVDAMFAPACSGNCRDLWEIEQRLLNVAPPIVVRAP